MNLLTVILVIIHQISPSIQNEKDLKCFKDSFRDIKQLPINKAQKWVSEFIDKANQSRLFGNNCLVVEFDKFFLFYRMQLGKT